MQANQTKETGTGPYQGTIIVPGVVGPNDPMRSGYPALHIQTQKFLEQNLPVGNLPKFNSADAKLYDSLVADRKKYMDPFTLAHSQRVSAYAQVLLASLDPDNRVSLEAMFYAGAAGFNHDVGKEYTPASVLLKPGKLNRQEAIVMSDHPVDGLYAIMNSPHFLKMSDEGKAIMLQYILPSVGLHHVHFDGKGGYGVGLVDGKNPIPKAMFEGDNVPEFTTAYTNFCGGSLGQLPSGYDLPFLTLVVAAADLADAAMSIRPYKNLMTGDSPKTISQVVAENRKVAGTQLEPIIALKSAEVLESMLANVQGIELSVFALLDMKTDSGSYDVITNAIHTLEASRGITNGHFSSIDNMLVSPTDETNPKVELQIDLGLRAQAWASQAKGSFVETALHSYLDNVAADIAFGLAQAKGLGEVQAKDLSSAVSNLMKLYADQKSSKSVRFSFGDTDVSGTGDPRFKVIMPYDSSVDLQNGGWKPSSVQVKEGKGTGGNNLIYLSVDQLVN